MNYGTLIMKKSLLLLGALFTACLAHAEMKMYFVHNDHLGTPQYLTDMDQNVVWKVESQTPFGEVIVNEDPDGDGEAVEFNLRFAGQYFDKETNSNYNYYRTYDPSLGRYIQSDPIGLRGGINTYAYVAGNPLKYIDPLGLDFALGVNPNQAGGNGHTTLYYQDRNGNWYSFDQGASGQTSSGGNLGFVSGSDATAGVTIVPIQLPPIDAEYFQTPPDRDQMIEDCALESQQEHNGGDRDYNLWSNNCTDAAVDVLRCADIRTHNPPLTVRPNTWREELRTNRPSMCRQTRRGLRCQQL